MLVTHSGTTATSAGSSAATYVGVTPDGAYVIFSSKNAAQFGTSNNLSTGSAFGGVNATTDTHIFAYQLATGQQTLLTHSPTSLTSQASTSFNLTYWAIGNDSRYVIFNAGMVSNYGNVSDGFTGVKSNDYKALIGSVIESGWYFLISHSNVSVNRNATQQDNFSTSNPVSNIGYSGQSANGDCVVFTNPNISFYGTASYASTAMGLAFSDYGTGIYDLISYQVSTGEQRLVTHLGTSTMTSGFSTATYAGLTADNQYVLFNSPNATQFGTAVNGSTGIAFSDGSISSTDVFAYNVITGAQVLVSHSGTSTLVAGTAVSTYQATTADGAYVIFSSPNAAQYGTASNGSTGTAFSDSSTTSTDIVAYKLATGAQVLVSHNSVSTLTAGTASATYAGVSSDGRYVFFTSLNATQFGNNGSAFVDSNGTSLADLYSYELSTGIQRMLSLGMLSAVSYAGTSADGNYCYFTVANVGALSDHTASGTYSDGGTSATDLMAVRLNVLDLATANDLGSNAFDNITSATSFTLNAVVNATQTVSLYEVGVAAVLSANQTADASGAVSFTLTGVSAGTHKYALVDSTTSKLISYLADTDSGSYLTVTVGAAPDAPTIDTVSVDGYVNSTERTNGVLVTGTAVGSSTVSVSWAGGGTVTGVVNRAGVWSVLFPTVYVPTGSDGGTSYAITVVATTVAGVASSSASRTVTVDTVAPTAPTFYAAVSGGANSALFDNVITSTEKANGFTLSGTGVANSTLTLTWGSFSRSVGVASTGIWSSSFTSTSAELGSDGVYPITITSQSDTAGNTSSSSTYVASNTSLSCNYVAVNATATAKVVSSLSLITQTGTDMFVAGDPQPFTATTSTYGDGRSMIFTSAYPRLMGTETYYNTSGAAFTSSADVKNVLAYNFSSGALVLVSHSGTSTLAAGSIAAAYRGASANGNYVVFSGADSSQYGTAINGATGVGFTDNSATSTDYLVYNLSTGAQSLVNHSSTSTTVAATSTLTYRTVSAGSTAYVIFDSANATLFGTAVNGGGVGAAFADGSTSVNDLFAYNLATGQQTLASHSGTSTLVAGNVAVTYLAVDSTGRYVIFSASDASQFGTVTNTQAGSAFTDNSTSALDLLIYDLSTGQQRLVSHSSTTVTASAAVASTYAGMSSDGAYVFFSSTLASSFGTATNDATGVAFTDTTNVTDLLAYNLSTGQQLLVSHSNAATTTAATSAASYSTISALNSKFVFFTSPNATAFGFTDSSTSVSDLLAYNLSTGQQLLVNHSSASTTTTGALANAYSGVSRDGSYVMFTETNASLLGNSSVSFTDGHTALADLFAYKTSDYTQSLISHSGTSTLVSAMAAVTYLSVTAQGEYVVFSAKDASLFGTATNASTGVAFTDNGKGFDDLFAYNTSTGEIKLITHTGSMSGGLYTTAGYSSSVTYKDISADGRYALFEVNDPTQFGNNKLSLSTNEKTNVFSYEFATGTLRCLGANQDLTTSEASYQGISADGNYVYLSLTSELTRLADHTGTATFTATFGTPQAMMATRLNVLDLATASDTVTSASGTVYDNITAATSLTLNAVVTANLSVKLYETISGVETAIGDFVTSDAAGLATFNVTGISTGAHTYFVKDSTGQAITYLAGTTSGQYLTVTVTAGPFMSSLQALLFSADGVQQGAFSTDSQGALTLDSGEVGTGSLLWVLKDSNGDAADYLDEFTGLAVDLRSDLRTVVDAGASGGALAVNPLSELAVRLCEQHSGAIPSLAQFSAMKTALAVAFGLSELSQTAVAVNSADFASATAGEQDYGRLLGVMSTLDYMFGDMDQALNALTKHATVRYGADGTPAQVTWTEEMQSWIDIAWVGMNAYTAHADNNAQIQGQAALLPALSAQGVLLDAPGTNSTLTATASQTLVMAGDGDDKIQSAAGIQTVFGGAGVDSYALTGAGVALDFSRLYGMEQIDLSGTGDNSVRLTLDMVLKQGGQANWLQSHGWEGLGNTDAQQLVITGDVGDTVQLSGLSASGKSVAHAGHVYQLYEGTSVSQGYLQLLVDQNLAVSTMVL